MDQGTEPIRQDIEAIRDSMTEKVEQIESKIKDTVEDTKRMVDIKYQVSQHPWAALGVSVLIGYALGSVGNGRSAEQPERGAAFRYYSDATDDRSRSVTDASERYRYAGTSYSPQSQQKSEPGMVDQLVDQLGDELQMLKAAAVTSLIDLVRDAVRQNLPAVHQQLEQLRDQSGTTTATPSSGSYDTADTASRYYDTAETKARERAIGETASAQTDAGRNPTYNYASPASAGELDRRT